MIILKRSKLNETLKTKNYQIICEAVEKKKTSPIDTSYQIFLCHSTKDKQEIIALKTYFNNINQNVYVAEIDDPQLDPCNVTKETADVLQKRMKMCKNLYYVLSKNSQDSTWMPWELGYFDGIKGSANIKILPIIDKNETEILSFKGHEYLGLYDENQSYIESLKIQKEIENKDIYVF